MSGHNTSSGVGDAGGRGGVVYKEPEAGKENWFIVHKRIEDIE